MPHHPVSPIGLLLAVLAAPAAAQTALDDSSAATDLDAVSVQATRQDPRRGDTASRLVFDQEELARHGDSSLVDALKRLPGVTVGTPAPGRSGAIALRGMGAGYAQILVDGRQPPAGFDIESLTPEMVERVEILRTPGADQRAEAIAGTLNIVLAGIRRDDGDTLKLTWASTSNGRQLPSASWQRSRRSAERSHALLASVSRRDFLVEEEGIERAFDADGAELLARSTRLRAEGRREVLSLAPSIELHPGRDSTLRLQVSAEASRFERTTDIDWTTQHGPPLRHVRYRQRTGIDVALLQGSARWTRERDDGSRSEATLSAGGNRERYAFREHARDGDGLPSLYERTDARLRVHDLGSSGSHTLPAGERHLLKLGWDASLDGRHEQRTQTIDDIAQAQITASALGFDAGIRRLALYAQDELALGPRWSLSLGARWERIETRSDGDGFDGILNRSQVVSPVLQSLWRLPGDNRLRLGLSRTFKAPTLASLIPRPYTTTNNRPMNPDEIGNPALRPELATGLDLAWETGNSNGLQFNIGGYMRRIEDIVRDELHQRDGRWVTTPVNAGRALAWGLELDGSLPLSALRDDAPEIELRFNATRAWSRVDDVPGPDNRIPGQTGLSAGIDADYRIGPRWSAGIGYRHRSGDTTRVTASLLEWEAPRRELDLHATWSPGTRTRLRLSASDALGQDLRSGQRHLTADGWQEMMHDRRGVAQIRAHLEIRL